MATCRSNVLDESMESQVRTWTWRRGKEGKKKRKNGSETEK
jgi:hypothetical protein